MNGLAPLMSSAQQDWRTPKALFDAVSAIAGGFDLDAAADVTNAMCGAYFMETDALQEDWYFGAGTRVWLNPPYGPALKQFAVKAVEQVSKYQSLEVWLLVPARTDTRWWNLLMTRAREVWFLAGRVKFERPDGARAGAPFPSAIVRLGHEACVPLVHWGWRP